jgi:hypothetical protein
MLQSSLEFDAAASQADAAVYAALHATRRADAGHYDELLEATGQTLRPAWRRFFGLLGPAVSRSCRAASSRSRSRSAATASPTTSTGAAAPAARRARSPASGRGRSACCRC